SSDLLAQTASTHSAQSLFRQQFFVRTLSLRMPVVNIVSFLLFAIKLPQYSSFHSFLFEMLHNSYFHDVRPSSLEPLGHSFHTFPIKSFVVFSGQNPSRQEQLLLFQLFHKGHK